MERRMRASYIVCASCALTACVLLSHHASGQTSAGTPSAQVRADTNLVVIPVTVTDELNRFVLGLQKEDFRLSEDGVEQILAHFSGEDAPLSVGVAFDESGSMDYKLTTSREATAQFLKLLNKDDAAFLVEFGEVAKLSFGLTVHVEEIETALRNAQPAGLTAMLDAINLGPHEIGEGEESSQGTRDPFLMAVITTATTREFKAQTGS